VFELLYHNSSLVFTANCQKSALPLIAGTIMPQNKHFAVKWRPNRRIVEKNLIFPLLVHSEP
jgi:hypothetical protein